jgi:altronate hydrolase
LGRKRMNGEAQTCTIHLHPEDPIAIARCELTVGMELALSDGTITVREAVPAGHKLALKDILAGEEIRRYGYVIGRAKTFIPAGSWVHSHNLELGESSVERAVRVVQPEKPVSSGKTFMGYERPGRRAGLRNYIALISTVTCSAHVTSQIARAFTPERLAAYPNVDGVVAIVHHTGCSMPPGGLSQRYLRRALTNLAFHPNVAAAFYIGLGCEVMQVDDCQPAFSMEEVAGLAPSSLVIQDQGGFQKTVRAGIERVEALLPQVNAIPRGPQPLADLVVALQCGGSDGWSGITANPLVGRVTDRLVREGATAVLAETPEIYGAEHLLTRRVTSQETAEKLMERIAWWEEQARRRGFSLDNNPTPGNKQGGLTTIFEKSLGAVAKAGSSPLNGVYEYGEHVEARGLVFMDTPGNDPLSVTGQVAGGCSLILFTTGRGSVYGSTLAPCLKIASNSRLAERMEEDMDFNAGQILEGLAWEEASQQLFEQVIETASGQRTKSERNGLSEQEFVPWQPDASL